MKPVRLVMAWSTVVANRTSQVFVPATAWGPAAGFTKARGEGELRNRIGELEARPAVQWANFEDGSGAVTDVVGQLMNTDQYWPPAASSTTVTSRSEQYRLVRAGWLVNVKTGFSGPVFGRVGGLVEIWTD